MGTLTYFRAVAVASLLTAGALVSSCGSDGGSGSDDGLLFHGEAKLLEGFKFDTGPQPPSGPANVTLRMSGGGTLKVDARGAVDSGKVVGRAGTGTVALEAHVNLDGTLKVDTGLKTTTGDIPGLKDINIPINGTSSFDPFLLEGGSSAEVVAELPETKLPDIPLGSVPGKLQLTIVSGSKLTSKFTATCMTVSGGSAQYEGVADTSGTLVLKGTIVLELPAPLNKSIALPEIKVPIPNAKSKVDFAAVATSGAADDKVGTCSGSSSDDAGPGSDTSTSGDSASPVDSSSPDTGSSSDTSTDTSTGDTAPPYCSSERFEPDDTVSTARILGTITDCDGSGGTASNVLSDWSDIDVMRFDGNDTFGCSVNPWAKVTGPAQICLRPSCTAGTTELQGCPKGTKTGSECCGTEVEADYNCNGTSDDNARIYITVRASGASTCSNYSVQYHF